jgi:predicted metalloprotease with PDZ domain
VYQIQEIIPVRGGHPLTLRFPQWSTGDHAPTVPLDGLAGLIITANDRQVSWVRDSSDVHSFHVTVPAGARELDVRYQYLAPGDHSIGSVTVTPAMLDLQWQTVVLYPAGHYVRKITYRPSVTLPQGWQFATALDGAVRTGDVVDFAPVTLDALVDSPVLAAAHVRRLLLDDGPVQVSLDLAGETDAATQPSPGAVERYSSVVKQAYRLFGSRHYDHYDFLLWLSDDISTYYEHHRSGEQSVPADFFSRWSSSTGYRAAPVHGYVHSWNGTFRRPVEMWTPDFNTPERDSLLWMFEGLTEYWKVVLCARAGLWTQEEALDSFRNTAANVANRSGAAWRPLQDVNNDLLISFRKPLSWAGWQRDMFDAYEEGELIWLDADTLIRELTRNERSLDDFARSFFGVRAGSYGEYTYTLDDVVAALNRIAPYDWTGFFRTRLEHTAPPTRLDGLERGGYRLTYTEVPSPALKAQRDAKGIVNLSYSLGVVIDQGGKVIELAWGGPAYNAGLTQGAAVLSVNGLPFSGTTLEEAVKATRAGTPLALTAKIGKEERTLHIDWSGGLRYSHLERVSAKPALIDDILAPRP